MTLMTTLVLVHVLISLVGLATGFVVLYGLLTAQRLDRWTALFLGTTVATSLSGFIIPADRFLPSHAVGIVSMVVLAVAIFAWYARELEGWWRAAYVVGAIAALHLNVLVFIVQAFQKVPALNALAPTQAEPPFLVAQLGALALLAACGVVALLRFRPAASAPAAPSSAQGGSEAPAAKAMSATQR